MHLQPVSAEALRNMQQDRSPKVVAFIWRMHGVRDVRGYVDEIDVRELRR